jgi:GGDEF domain-containing protein
MTAMALDKPRYDDPRRMRELLVRYSDLAKKHSLCSTLVGMSAAEGDLVFPELIDFLESALRVDDRIFRMTRERAILFLADVDSAQAEHVIERNLASFRANFCVSADPVFQTRYFEVRPQGQVLSLREVLPALFGAGSGESALN